MQFFSILKFDLLCNQAFRVGCLLTCSDHNENRSPKFELFFFILRSVVFLNFKSRKYLNAKLSNWDILILILDKIKQNIDYKSPEPFAFNKHVEINHDIDSFTNNLFVILCTQRPDDAKIDN